MGFPIPKKGKFWSISLEHFIKHKPLFSEEWVVYVCGFSYCFCLLKLYQQNAAGKIMCSMYSVRKPLRFFYTDVGTLKKVFFSCFSLYSHRWKLCQHCLRQPFMTWTILALPTSFSSIQVKTKKQKVYSRLGNDNQVQFWLFGYSNLKYFNYGWDLEYESTRAPNARGRIF